MDSCGGLAPLVSIIKNGIFPLVQIVIPIILLLLGTIDLGKAIIANDDKDVKAAQGRLIKRVIYAILIFFIVTIVSLVMGLVAEGSNDTDNADDDGWQECWTSV